MVCVITIPEHRLRARRRIQFVGDASAVTEHRVNAGVAPQTLLVQRAAIATEVTEGNAYFFLPFPVVSAMAFVRTAAGVSKAWDGAVSFTANRVKLDNAGATDWAAGDVLFCLASG